MSSAGFREIKYNDSSEFLTFRDVWCNPSSSTATLLSYDASEGKQPPSKFGLLKSDVGQAFCTAEQVNDLKMRYSENLTSEEIGNCEKNIKRVFSAQGLEGSLIHRKLRQPSPKVSPAERTINDSFSIGESVKIADFTISSYENEIKRFADKPVREITLDSIDAEVKHLKALFPGNTEQKIIKDLCTALMASPLIYQAIYGLIDLDAIEQAVATRRAGLNAEKQELLTRLAQLYKADETTHNPIFQGENFLFEGQLYQAWVSWKGYQTEGRASINPGKVIININGTETEVDGIVGTDAWGNNIGGHVWVSGTEQTQLTKMLAFFAEHKGVATRGTFDLYSCESLSALIGFDRREEEPRLTTLHAEAMNAFSANVAAKHRFEQLHAERVAKEDRISGLDRENDESAIRTAVIGAINARADFLNIFVPRHNHGLDEAANRLTHLLQLGAKA